MTKPSDSSCPKCHEPIEADVVLCPHCGANIGGSDSWLQTCLTVVFTLFGIVLLLVGGCTVAFGAGLFDFGAGQLLYELLAIGAVVAAAGLLVIRAALGRGRDR